MAADETSGLELPLVFLKLGFVGFGGPVAHVALMRRELVERRRWFAEDEFLRMFAACNLIPGPSSTELAIFLGWQRARWRGMLTAGTLFILPAALIMVAIAALYARWGDQPAAAHLLAGIRPPVLGIVLWAVLDLGGRLAGDRRRLAIAAAAGALLLLHVSPVAIVTVGGVALAARGLVWPVLAAPAAPAAGHGVSLLSLFLAFLKIGAISFGSGYVLLALLRADLVDASHWLSDRQLVDAIAIGQATPGPVFTTATFIGYLLGGVPGAAVATLGIFLPGFALVPLLDRLSRLVERRSWAKAFLDGANAAALGMIAAVAAQLAGVAVVSLPAAVMAIAAMAAMQRWPLGSPILVAAGAAAGLLGLVG
jgi:chromate transporter